MRDRIGALGGTLSIAAAPGAGTRIAGSLPVERG
jgi:signal transduction histidine kinase